MKLIRFTDPHQRRAFEFFNALNHPHHSMVVQVDLGRLPEFLKDHNYRFTEGVLWLITRAANDLPRFRWRIRGNEVVEHRAVRPSLTVKTQRSETFSFCTVAYAPRAATFLENYRRAYARVQTEPSFADETGADDYLFVSSVPWVSFTSLEHAMPYHPTDSVPRITWGKTHEDFRGAARLPLGVQVHHAVVDGQHVGDFYRRVEAYAAAPERLFSKD